MKIETADFVAGARAARGLVVIIDVFRAFSVAAYAFARGARSVVPLASVDEARALKQRNPDWLLMGERHARPLPGFDCGNSPTELERLPVAGRTIIHTTHSGTQGLTQALQADEVITGALVNLGAIARYVRWRAPETLTLVRMGHEARERCAEDDLCAELIARRLHLHPGMARVATATEPERGGSKIGGHSQWCLDDEDDVRERLRAAPSAQKFFDPACDWAPERDFELCTAIDAFDFVLRLERGAELAHLRRVDVQ